MSYIETFTGQDEPVITCESESDCKGIESGLNIWLIIIICLVCIIESCRHDKKDF